MSFTWDILPGNAGCIPRTEEVRLTAHGTITAGRVYTLDLETATAANHGVCDTSAAAAAGANEGNVWVLALESGSSGDRLKFLLRGYGTIQNDGTDLAKEIPLTSDANGDVVVAAANDVIIALNLVAVTATTGKCWFDGSGITIKGA